MISNQMKNYNYQTYIDRDEYGQPALSTDTKEVKMAIYFASEAINENPLYSGAQYTGLTLDKGIAANCVIHYGDEKLKVLYVNSAGRYIQVFMARM